MEGAVVAAFDAPELFAGHLPEGLRIRMLKKALAGGGDAAGERGDNAARKRDPEMEELLAGPETFASYKDFRRDVLDVAEKRYFSRLMEVASGNIERACQLSGLARAAFTTSSKSMASIRAEAFPIILE
jgi:hypothetical protein